MKAVKGGLIQRSDSTPSVLSTMKSNTSNTSARTSRPKIDLLRATPAFPNPAYASGGQSTHALHDDGLDRDVIEAALTPGLDGGDFVDDIHPFGDTRKHGITKVAARMIERTVVLQIDKELRGRAVDVIGARHGERAALVLDVIVRLVLDWRVSALLRHVFG